jgi:hypothetical protein
MLVLLSLLNTADAAPVKVGLVTSTTTYPDTDGVSYKAAHAVDGKQSTVWVEGDESGSGLGAEVTFNFDEPTTVDSFRIWNGNYYSYDFWERHNRIKEVEVEFSDGSKQKITLTDEMKPELIKLDKPVETTSITFEIKGIYRGTTFNDTVISEVIFYDKTPDPYIPVTAYKASSVYAADADGTYEPINMADGINDSMWCEAGDGDGTGEWVEFNFGSAQDVRSMTLVNGNGYSFPFFMKGNRATKATLSFSDGSTEDVDIKNSLMPQTITFPEHETTKVKVTFTEVYKGKEFNDLCVSEAYFK